MSNIWFWSDPHAYHKNIIKYSSRPFANVDEMNEFMITEHNKLVQPGDSVYCLGDVAPFTKIAQTDNFLRRLNGQKFLIRGNHDEQIPNTHPMFGWVKDYYETKIDNIWVVMCHYPFLTWHGEAKGAIALSGHTHDAKWLVRPNRKGIHVGVDAWGYKPISWEQIKAKAETINVKLDYDNL